MTDTYLALGTNLGDRQANLDRAITLINEKVGNVVARSSVMETAPWGFQSDNRFANMVVKVRTALPPIELLAATQAIERQMGRTEKSLNGVYHDRIIDIDILLYGALRLETPALSIPHPLMWQRDFVMVPLRELLTEAEIEIFKSTK